MTKTVPWPFQLGVSFRKIDYHQNLETIKILAGSMVKSVELFELTFWKGEKAIADARRAFEAAGVETRSIHAVLGGSDISSSDRSVRSLAIEKIGGLLNLATKVGAPIIIVHPSSGSDDKNFRTERMKHAKQSIATLAKMAGDVGCQIAVELMQRTCMGTAADMLEIIEGTDPSTAGVCLDTNHLSGRFASLPEEVYTLGSRLIALHCSDYDGIKEKHWPPMRGVINWNAFLAALEAIGFSGPLTYEANFDGETPEEQLALLEANFTQLMEAYVTASPTV